MREDGQMTIYVLYGGSSPDGRGPGVWERSTTSREEAEAHLKKIGANPYSTGYVLIVSMTAEPKRWWR